MSDARVDLKTDRKARCLRVLGAYAEAGISQPAVAAALSAELAALATWHGLDEVAVARRGDLARWLAIEVRRAPLQDDVQ